MTSALRAEPTITRACRPDRLGRPDRSMARAPRRRLAGSLVVLGCALGIVAHGLAAASTGEAPMAIVMALMALGCATCLVHLGHAERGAEHAAAHLLWMTVAMLAVHAVWLLAPGSGATHDHGAAALGSPTDAVDHGSGMAATVLVEFAVLCAASAALRILRPRDVVTDTTPVPVSDPDTDPEESSR